MPRRRADEAQLEVLAPGTAYERLTPVRRRFVDAVLTADSAAQAYRDTFPRAKGKDTPKANAARLLQDPTVRAAMLERQEAVAIASGLNAARIVREFAALAYAHAGQFEVRGGRVVAKDGCEDAERALVEQSASVTKRVLKGAGRNGADVETVTGDTHWKISATNKLGALNALARIAGLFDPAPDDADDDFTDLPQMAPRLDTSLPAPPPDADDAGGAA